MGFRLSSRSGASSRRRHRPLAVIAVASMACAAVSVVSVSAAVSTAGATKFTPPAARKYPVNLPASLVHPGSVIVAFQTPVASSGDRVKRAAQGGAATADAPIGGEGPEESAVHVIDG